MSVPPGFWSLRPGLVPYPAALALQERLLERRPGLDGDVLLLLRHPPVVTLGRGADPAHVRLAPGELAARGIALAPTSRGGDVTYHGPGQVTGYPILDLACLGRNLDRYLRLLEELLIATLADFGLRGRREASRTGVWVGNVKIASIGIGVRRWIAWHGFSLNVADDLEGFAAIDPCGEAQLRLTSMEAELGGPVPLPEVETSLIEGFARTFGHVYRGEWSGDATA